MDLIVSTADITFGPYQGFHPCYSNNVLLPRDLPQLIGPRPWRPPYISDEGICRSLSSEAIETANEVSNLKF